MNIVSRKLWLNSVFRVVSLLRVVLRHDHNSFLVVLRLQINIFIVWEKPGVKSDGRLDAWFFA